MKKILFILIILCFGAVSASAQFATNLPIVKLVTSQAIVDTYRQVALNIINNSSGTNAPTDPATFTSNAGVKLRGSAVSQAYPKKSYSLETWLGFNVSNNVSLLGMPPENDWVLLAAYTDRSLLRSKLALELHNEMDRYAPRMIYCELFIDTTYQGIYLLGEKIKRDTARLDLATLKTTDNFGEQLTGGYILNVDNENGSGFVSNYPPPNAGAGQQVKFLYEYPDNGAITPAQKNYIKSYIDSFENGLNGANYQDSLLGWRPFGANNSFIDYIIANEVSRNYDAYRIDMYLYKDKSKKMRPGPMWGFDAAFANTANCGANGTAGFAYNLGATCATAPKLPAFWWSKLMTDVQFVKDLKCRYTQYRYAGGVLDTTHIFGLIDSFSAHITMQGASTRNFAKYPIFGTPIINEPTPMAANQAQEVASIKSFIQARLVWLDAQWFDNSCAPISVKEVQRASDISIYPNPAHQLISIQSKSTQPMRYELKTITGKILQIGNQAQGGTAQISLANIIPGIYLLLIDQGEERYMKKVVVE